MSKTVVVACIAREQAGRLEAVAAWGRGWAWASLVTVLLTLSLVLVGEGAPGDLDPTSGRGGTVTTDFGGGDQAYALVLQPDGKLVAAGVSSSVFALARYLPDGRLDLSFGVGGRVTTDFGGGDQAYALVLQPDGKLVAAGFSHNVSGNPDFALARYLPDGHLDPSFGVGGTVTTAFGFEDIAYTLVLQPDGKLVAAGAASDVSGNVDFALARYLPDGRLDPTFGNGGKVTTAFGGASNALALVLQPDGKLVAAGPSFSGFYDFALARYLSDGHLDASFGGGGKVTTDFAGSTDEAFALVLQPDGKLVAAGSASDGSGSHFALARYLPDGGLDPSFGVGGTVITDFDLAIALALVLQPDGKLVAAGGGGSSEAGDVALARYLPDGHLDSSFGVGGKVITDVGGDDFAEALVLQPDGKLVAAGSSTVGGTEENLWDFALARYRPDGHLDPTFGTGFEINVNNLVTFEPITSTFTFTPDAPGCPEGFVGTFSFEARLTNTSESSLTALVVAVTILTNDNLLQNADGGPGGVGARLTVPQEDGFSDGVLSPEEFVDVPFVICLTQQQPFTFVVDVLGVVEASADAEAKAPLVP